MNWIHFGITVLCLKFGRNTFRHSVTTICKDESIFVREAIVHLLHFSNQTNHKNVQSSKSKKNNNKNLPVSSHPTTYTQDFPFLVSQKALHGFAGLFGVIVTLWSLVLLTLSILSRRSHVFLLHPLTHG